jgi:guanylate kinase
VTEGDAQFAAAPRAPAAKAGGEADRVEEGHGGRREEATKERHAVRGLLVILSAPSGAGKDVVIEGLLRELEDATLYVTATSRGPRAGEVHGRHYYFYSPQKFREEIEQGNFLEWSVVHGEYKGVRGDAVADALRRHRIVLVKPDPQGMRKLKAVLPEALTIFIQPESLDQLRKQLVGRGTETPESLELRMKNAEIEMAAAPEYDHVVVNEDGKLDETVREVAEIVRKEAEHPRTYWL